MPNTKEIKNRIKSVRDTQKITNAMYLISSTKLRRAKAELDKTRPYFKYLQVEIKRIFRTAPDIDSRYFYPPEGSDSLSGAYGCLVITSDKGLAGAYNHNVLKMVEETLKTHPDTRLFVVGEYGRQYFMRKHIPIEETFLYPAQNPTMQRAREICSKLLERYDQGELDKIFVMYTDMKNSLTPEATATRLLPFHRNQFFPENEGAEHKAFEFTPSVEVVLEHVIQSYVTGYIYSALVDSFCSEQNSRMIAMNSAGQNADKILAGLSLQYNRVRQSAITQEITEIASGARAQRVDLDGV